MYQMSRKLEFARVWLKQIRLLFLHKFARRHFLVLVVIEAEVRLLNCMFFLYQNHA